MLTDLEKDAIRRHYQAISENLPHFRPRKAQREMLAAVANTLSRTLEKADGEEPPAPQDITRAPRRNQEDAEDQSVSGDDELKAAAARLQAVRDRCQNDIDG